MREGWRRVVIGDVLELGPSGLWGDGEQGEGTVPFVCLRGVDIGALRAGSLPDPPIRHAVEHSLSRKECAAETILIETSGSKCGRSVVLTQAHLDGFPHRVAFSNFCRCLIPDGSHVDEAFAGVWLGWMYDRGTLPLWRATSAMPNLDVKGFLAGQQIDLPPLPEQRRIVDLIGAVDAQIEAADHAVERAERARRGLLSELLAPATREGWRRVDLKEVAEVVGGGTPSTAEPSYWGGPIAWATPSEVVGIDGGIIRDTDRTLTPEGLASSGARLLPAGSILVTSRASVGFVAIAGSEIATNQGFASLLPGDEVLSRFLMYWVQANRAEFERRAAGSTFKEISRTNTGSIPIDLPPLPEQRRIVDLVAAADSEIGALKAVADQARELRKGLLTDLLSGAHEIPALYDRLLAA